MGTGATIGGLRAEEMTATIYCREEIHCGHSAELDLAQLEAAAGRPDVGLYDPKLQRRLVCTRCRRRGATFIIRVPDWCLSSGGRDRRKAIGGKSP